MARLTYDLFYKSLTRPVKLAISERIRSCMNTVLSEWTDQLLIDYGPYVIYLPADTIQRELAQSYTKVILHKQSD